MNLEQLIPLVLAGGLGALIKALVDAYTARAAARREDRKSSADSASTLVTAATNVVALQEKEAQQARQELDDLRQEMRALQSEASAIRAALQVETEKRLLVEANAKMRGEQIERLQEQLAEIKSLYFRGQDELKRARREVDGLKGALFNMAIGVATLNRQLEEAGLKPKYTLDVPVVSDTPGSS